MVWVSIHHILVVLYIRALFRVLFVRVPYDLGKLERKKIDPISETL